MKEIKLGNHLLYCGDCAELVLDIKPSLLLTDPPYGINKIGVFGDQKSNYTNIIDQICSMFDMCDKNASAFVFGMQPNLSKLTNVVDDRYHFLQSLVWIKSNQRSGPNKFGVRKEEIIYFTKKGAKNIFNNNYVDWKKYKYLMSDFTLYKREVNIQSLRIEKEFLKMIDVFKYPSINGGSFNKQEKFAGSHPTMKPVPLLEDLILQTTNEGDWVFDPYSGSGSVLIACENTNRRCISVEIDDKYCDIIVNRFNQHTNERSKII